MKMYRLSVKTRRVITVAPVKKAETVECEYDLGDIPAAGELHARNIYWKHCAHLKPGLLNHDGRPLATSPLKWKEIIVRLKQDGAEGLGPKVPEKAADGLFDGLPRIARAADIVMTRKQNA